MVLSTCFERCTAVMVILLQSWSTQDTAVCGFGVVSRLDTGRITRQPTVLRASGMGMGVAIAKKGKKGAKASPPFDASASLTRLEKKYDELTLANARAIAKDDDESTVSNNDEIVTSEYIIAARVTKVTSPELRSVSDWIPVAQMCIARTLQDAESSEGAADGSVRAAVSHFCREIFHAATLSAPVFRSLPRNEMEYSVESMDSFHKHVYNTVLDGKKEADKLEQTMSKSDARQVLKLDSDIDDASVIKRSYRSLLFQLHPDRFVGADKTPEELQAASHEYARVKLAYETLNSGVRKGDSSWYESLGGKSRTDFVGPITLLPLETAKDFIARSRIQSAVVGIDREMVQAFVARNQASSN